MFAGGSSRTTSQKPSFRHREANPRPDSRDIIRWDDNYYRRLLVIVHHVSTRDDVFLPWQHIATLMGDGLTVGAIKQHMEKLRRMVGRSWAVPAAPKRGGNRKPKPGSKEEKDKEHARLVDEVTAHDYRTMWEVAMSEGKDFEELPKTVVNWRRTGPIINDGQQALSDFAPEHDMPGDEQWPLPVFPPSGVEQYPAARLTSVRENVEVQPNIPIEVVEVAEQSAPAEQAPPASQTVTPALALSAPSPAEATGPPPCYPTPYHTPGKTLSKRRRDSDGADYFRSKRLQVPPRHDGVVNHVQRQQTFVPSSVAPAVSSAPSQQSSTMLGDYSSPAPFPLQPMAPVTPCTTTSTPYPEPVRCKHHSSDIAVNPPQYAPLPPTIPGTPLPLAIPGTPLPTALPGMSLPAPLPDISLPEMPFPAPMPETPLPVTALPAPTPALPAAVANLVPTDPMHLMVPEHCEYQFQMQDQQQQQQQQQQLGMQMWDGTPGLTATPGSVYPYPTFNPDYDLFSFTDLLKGTHDTGIIDEVTPLQEGQAEQGQRSLEDPFRNDDHGWESPRWQDTPGTLDASSLKTQDVNPYGQIPEDKIETYDDDDDDEDNQEMFNEITNGSHELTETVIETFKSKSTVIPLEDELASFEIPPQSPLSPPSSPKNQVETDANLSKRITDDPTTFFWNLPRLEQCNVSSPLQSPMGSRLEI